MGQLDDAVLALVAPSDDGEWIDQSAGGHTVSKVGTPVFSTDHWVTSPNDYFTVPHHADHALTDGPFTWLVVFAPTEAHPFPFHDIWMNKGGPALNYQQEGYRTYTYANGNGDTWSVIQGHLRQFVDGVDGVRRSLAGVFVPNVSHTNWDNGVLVGTRGATTYSYTQSVDLHLGMGAGKFYGAGLWKRALDGDDLNAAETEILAGAGGGGGGDADGPTRLFMFDVG